VLASALIGVSGAEDWPGRRRFLEVGRVIRVGNATFEIGFALKRKKAEPLPTAFKTRLMKTSDAIRNQTAPGKLLESLARRTTHTDSRKTVVDYLRARLFRA
jgi:hypothetical protein